MNLMGSFKFDLLSLNVRGIRSDKGKRTTLFNWLKCYAGNLNSLIFLQETHSTTKSEMIWYSEWGSDIYLAHGSHDSRGVAILLPRTLEVTVADQIIDPNGRYLLLDCTIEGTRFVLVNVYAPTKNVVNQQCVFLNDIREMLAPYMGENLIIGGDFNTILDPTLDKRGGRLEPTSQYMLDLREVIDDFDLVDIWRHKHPMTRMFTYQTSNRQNVSSRIDFWLVSTFLSPSVHKCEICPSIKTDHRLIKLCLKGEIWQKRGRGFWKFNAGLLREQDYVDQVKNMLQELRTKYRALQDKGLKWDTIKCEIRGLTIRYSKRRARQQRERYKELKVKLDQLTNQANENDYNDDLMNQIKQVTGQLEEINDEQTKAAILRSKVKYAELGEKNSKYFLGLEKRNFKTKCITALQTETGEVTKDPLEILKTGKRFYEKLYESKGVLNTDDFFQNVPALTEEQQLSCEGIILMEECKRALKDFKMNKTPGTDGWTTEFYKFFWGDIGDLVLDSLNWSFLSGNMSIDQRRGIISLIPKKDKDRTNLGNWRPITLLNFDYKLLTKVLSNRLKPLLTLLIDPDQTGYVSDRYIGENILLLTDILWTTKVRGEAGLLLLLDFKKAFDSIEWTFMEKTLNAFNFGENFKKWVKIMYTNITSCVTNNGNASDFFSLSRGVRQGCPLSPYLFILCVEILAIAIRKNTKIHGINIGGTTCKLSQFADDTTCFVRDIASAKELFYLLEKFGQCSGLYCNTEKTLARWIGRNVGLPPGELPVKWTEDAFDLLGITFSENTEEMEEMNYSKRIKKMNDLFRIWKMRDLSIIGKILVTKSLGISKLLYVASMIYTSENIKKEVQKDINAFVWKSKPPKVKMDTLVKQISGGGLKLVDFTTQVKALVLSWIGRFFNNSRAKWAATFNAQFHDFDVQDLLYSRCCWKGLELLNLPPLYRQMLEYWKEIRSHLKPMVDVNVTEEFIWFNSYITIEGETLFFKEWYRKGIKYIRDLLKDDGSFLSHIELEGKYEIHTNFLQCYQIRAAIPFTWKRILREGFVIERRQPALEFNIDEHTTKTIQNMTCKDFYWLLISMKRPTKPTAELKWAEDLNIQPDQLNWAEIYAVPSQCTLETKLRAFQYSCLHRYVPHKKLLFRQGLVEEESCNNCPEQDTILHRFWRCPTTNQFWMKVEQWLRQCLDGEFHLTMRDVIFGRHMMGDLDHMQYVTNNILLNAKSFIHSTKCRGAPLDFEFFKLYQKTKIAIEKEILTTKSRLDLFDNRWSNVIETLI